MFTIYHSNQLDLLKSLTAQLIKRQPLSSVFEKEVILVQSQGMGQWLQIQLAQELGISANIEYPFPAQFVWDIYRIFYPNLPQRNSFNVDFMTWALLAILPELTKTQKFSSLKHYFENDDEQKYYQLAHMMANLYDQYLVYRPDWIKAWQNGEKVDELSDDDEWQAILWRELVEYSQNVANISFHRAEIHQMVISDLSQARLSKTQKKQLPKRIFIFGIISLPPVYLDLFNAISQHIDVHFMFMNPCRQYWGDIIGHSFVNKYIHNPQLADMMLENSHPLLASWGKLGRDHLALLQNYNKQDIDAFFDYEKPSLLASVQQSILDMQNNLGGSDKHINFISNENKQKVLVSDDSISLHACHSEQREVEVLYDYLLSILDNDSSITLNDCVVMVADIDHYAPYIQAVFDNVPKSRALPYTISDQKFRYIDPIIQGFFLLLELPQSQLEIEYIFDLLEIPAIAKRFKLNEERLKQLQYWIVDSGIRYGLESMADEPHSWLIGLNRMLLGYLMDSELDCWQDVLPYDGTTGLDAELVGLLSDFIMAIAKWCEKLNDCHTITQWQELCWPLLMEFFILDSDSEPLLLMIQEQWQSVIDQALLSNYQSSVSLSILKSCLQTKFEQHAISHRFLIGRINFCTLMPMRSVPFKVVCLLGMNDGVYPRTLSQIGFDLIYQHGRIGDRSRRNDDRYLFLEALLSAEQKFYISYIGYDIQTNDIRYPSILVDELLEYLKLNYRLDGGQQLSLIEHEANLLNFLITTHTRMPFNFQNYSNNHSKQISYADEWLLAAKQLGRSNVFIDHLNIEKIDTINLDELKNFYIHPIKFFTKSRLSYSINHIDEQLPNTEHFNLNSLERYNINQQITSLLLPNNSESLSDKLYQKIQRSNQLPYGSFGHILYGQQKALMQPLINKVNNERDGEFISLDVNLDIDNVQLIGRLKNIQHDGLLQWRSAKLTVKDGLMLWIDHLILCILSPESTRYHNRIYGRDDTKWCFTPIPKIQAQLLLAQFISNYLTGMNQPFFMPLHCSWQWLETAYDEKTGNIHSDPAILAKARANFMANWQGNSYVQAECDDYYLRLYPELTDELIDTAIQAILIYLLPMMQYKEKQDVH